MLCIGIVLAFVAPIMSPFLTFGAYTGITLRGHGVLDSARLFTALSIVSLLGSPLIGILQSYPMIMASFGCIDRIEEFCLSDDQEDTRTCGAPESEVKPPIAENGCEKPYDLRHGDAVIAIKVEQASFGWNDQHLVKVANFAITYSQFVVISGPNGSGKSTFLKAVLGELPSKEGSFNLDTKEIAFCDQTPWLPNGTIQKCILGYGLFDKELYGEVIHLCDLNEDLEQMEDGDQTKIGSKGASRISGGQMQRIVSRAIVIPNVANIY